MSTDFSRALTGSRGRMSAPGGGGQQIQVCKIEKQTRLATNCDIIITNSLEKITNFIYCGI